MSAVRPSAWDKPVIPQELSTPEYRVWRLRHARHREQVETAHCATELAQIEREVKTLASYSSGHDHSRRKHREELEADVCRGNKLLVRKICDVARQSERRQIKLYESAKRRDGHEISTLNYNIRRQRQAAINAENAALLSRLVSTRSVVPSVAHFVRAHDLHTSMTKRISRHRRRFNVTRHTSPPSGAAHPVDASGRGNAPPRLPPIEDKRGLTPRWSAESDVPLSPEVVALEAAIIPPLARNRPLESLAIADKHTVFANSRAVSDCALPPGSHLEARAPFVDNCTEARSTSPARLAEPIPESTNTADNLTDLPPLAADTQTQSNGGICATVAHYDSRPASAASAAYTSPGGSRPTSNASSQSSFAQNVAIGEAAPSSADAIIAPLGPRAEDAWSEPSGSHSQWLPGSPAKGKQEADRPATASSVGTDDAEANRMHMVHSATDSETAQNMIAARSRTIEDGIDDSATLAANGNDDTKLSNNEEVSTATIADDTRTACGATADTNNIPIHEFVVEEIMPELTRNLAAGNSFDRNGNGVHAVHDKAPSVVDEDASLPFPGNDAAGAISASGGSIEEENEESYSADFAEVGMDIQESGADEVDSVVEDEVFEATPNIGDRSAWNDMRRDASEESAIADITIEDTEDVDLGDGGGIVDEADSIMEDSA